MLLFSRPVAGEEPSLKPNFDASAGSETAISVSTRRDVAPTVRDDVVVQSATRDARRGDAHHAPILPTLPARSCPVIGEAGDARIFHNRYGSTGRSWLGGIHLEYVPNS
jgi:hypothetical protein